ncbi:MAG: GNAT family N-acetyltransferase [Spirochaetia bacterium]
MDFQLQAVDNTNKNIIEESCDPEELEKYMSRFYPSENQALLWYLISCNNSFAGHVWIEKYKKENGGHKLGIAIWDNSKRGLGIGSWAITEVIKILVEHGYSKPIVLNVREVNQRAVKCYHKVGFQVVKREIGKKDNKEITFLQMKYVV